MWDREPVAVAEAIRLVLLAAVAFGVNLTPEQTAALCAAVSAVLTLVARSRVTPMP